MAFPKSETDNAYGFVVTNCPFALIGMQKEGKVADTLTRCHHCIQPIVEPMKPLRWCGNVVYCNEECKDNDIETDIGVIPNVSRTGRIPNVRFDFV